MKYRILTPMIPKPTLDGIYEYLLDEGKKLGIPDPLLNQISMENEGKEYCVKNFDENRKLQLVKNRFLNLVSTQ